MKSIFWAAIAAIAAIAATLSSTSMAAVTLVPKLTAPTELQLGEYAAYTLTLTNTGSEAANNAVLRLQLVGDMQVQQPLPDGCDEVVENYNGSPGVRQLRCVTAVPAFNKVRSFTAIIKAPTVQPSAPVVHNTFATADFATPVLSAPVVVDYRNFLIPITPNTIWEYRACSNGTAGPLAYDMCPTSGEAISKLNLQAGGSLLVSRKTSATTWGAWVAQMGTWLQTDPAMVQINWYPGRTNEATVNLHPISSRCFRGRGLSVTGTNIAASLCLMP